MVEAGSFYKTGLLPGTYNMIAQLASGKEVLLPDPVEIGVDPSYDLDMTMPGAIFKDTLRDMNGDFMPNQTIELIDVELGEDAAVMIMTDEEGNFSYGPLPEGDSTTVATLTTMDGTTSTSRPSSTPTFPTSRWLSTFQKPLT